MTEDWRTNRRFDRDSQGKKRTALCQFRGKVIGEYFSTSHTMKGVKLLGWYDFSLSRLPIGGIVDVCSGKMARRREAPESPPGAWVFAVVSWCRSCGCIVRMSALPGWSHLVRRRLCEDCGIFLSVGRDDKRPNLSLTLAYPCRHHWSWGTHVDHVMMRCSDTPMARKSGHQDQIACPLSKMCARMKSLTEPNSAYCFL
jgi:hypothetical protein